MKNAKIRLSIVAGALVFAAVQSFASTEPQLPVPPNWDAFLTRPYALQIRNGHTQGMCVSSNAIYITLFKGIYKFDWFGRLIARVEAEPHQGDICLWNGRLYTAVALEEPVGQNHGRICVYDENLNRLNSVDFEKSADGIVCVDGILHVGLAPAHNPKKNRGNWFCKFDAETLKPVCEPFIFDHGYDVTYGIQNLATDGEKIYMNVYTPDKGTPNFFVMDKNLKVLSAHLFGYGHGFDVIGGGENGAPRFIYSLTINWMGPSQSLKPDPSAPQALLRFAEMRNGRMRDVTRYR
jgi:hypothetical protein